MHEFFLRKIVNQLQYNKNQEKIFSIIGEQGAFTSFRKNLDKYGWKYNPIKGGINNINLIFCSASKEGLSLFCSSLELIENASFFILHMTSTPNKSLFFWELEKKGFYIISERNNYTLLFNQIQKIKELPIKHLLSNSSDISLQDHLPRKFGEVKNWNDIKTGIMNPSDLLHAKRFDIAIKSLFGRLHLKNMATQWVEALYFEHLLRITANISECDGAGKIGLQKFKKIFSSLLNLDNYNHLPAVFIDKNHVAFDGAHRISAAIVNQRNIPVIQINESRNNAASANFFMNTSFDYPAMPLNMIDESAIEYCRIKSGLVIALIFPKVNNIKIAQKTFEGLADIVYEKEIFLNNEGTLAFLRQIYLGHDWNKFDIENTGIINKAKSCLPFSGSVHAILLDNFSPKDIRVVKQLIRDYYGIGNDSIHMTDGDDEVLRLAKIIFNQNSIYMLNIGTKPSLNFHKNLFAYRDWLEKHNLDENLFCIDGGAILDILGLRETRDLDFLYHGDKHALPQTPEFIDCHNDLERYHKYSVSDIIGDPRLHFWYMGVKFATPDVVYSMKAQRREPKDCLDMAMLQEKVKEHSKYFNIILRKLRQIESWLRYRVYYIYIKLKSII